MNKLKLQSIIIAVSIYLSLIIVLIISMYYKPSTPKAKIYTAKKSDIIEVSLGSPIHTVPKKEHKIKKKHSKKKDKVPKKVRNVKKPVKKHIKKKKVIKKHKTITKNVKKVTRKPDTNSLFKNLPNSIKDDKPESKAIGKSGKSAKKVNKSNGIENAYFAKIQNTLKGWPAQNNFVGEKIKVELTVYATGMFDYKILSRSLNPEFNNALKRYLEQLKRFGFGPHHNPKPYKIIVDFIAK